MLTSSPKVPAPKTLCLSKDLTLQQEDNNYYTDLSETGKTCSENQGIPTLPRDALQYKRKESLAGRPSTLSRTKITLPSPKQEASSFTNLQHRS